MIFNLHQERNKYRSTQMEWEIHDQIICNITIMNNNLDQEGNMSFMHLFW
jgi:hypothetical protein